MRSCPVCRREARRLRLRDARAAAAHPYHQHDRTLGRRSAWRVFRRHLLPQVLGGTVIGILLAAAATALANALVAGVRL